MNCRKFCSVRSTGFLSVALAVLVTACGSVQTANIKSRSNLEAEFPVRLESSGMADQPWVWLALAASRGTLVVCSGGECGKEGVTVTLLEARGQDESQGRMLYRSKYPVELSEKRQLTIASVDGTWDPSNLSSLSFNVLRKIRVRSTNPGNLPTLDEGQPGDFNLNLPEVFNQGASNWCWGYSAFHAMTTFFNHLPETGDQEIEAYRSSVKAVKTNQDLRALMGRHADQWQLGSPFQFLNLFREDRALPDKMGWRNLKGSRDSVMQQVTWNLRRGIPSAYCYASHCVTIYGFSSDGQKVVKFTIADSQNSRRYTKSVEAVQSDFWAMWSLPDGRINKTQGSASNLFSATHSEAVDPFEAAQFRLK